MAADILKVICNAGLTEPGKNQAVFIVIDAEAHVVSNQGNTAQHQQRGAAYQHPFSIVHAHKYGCRAESKHDKADGAIALAEPDRLAATVLHLTPEQLGEAFVHQVAEAEHHRHDQNNTCNTHDVSSNYAHRTQSTGMS